MTKPPPCPCHSGRTYPECCGSLLSGERTAVTAEALMRSRYTAYVVRNITYLLQSWHPSTRPADINPGSFPKWQGLHIIRTEAGSEGDDKGVVEFKATFLTGKGNGVLHEISRFVKENGRWFYVNGELQDTGLSAAKTEVKVGRNTLCTCGSGKKFKKCCGS